MSRSFLTGLNLNKNELLNARIQNLANNPSSPVSGQIYYNTGDNTLRYWNGTSWLTLAQGGDLAGAISAAIDALTTSDIEEGTNLYFTDERAQDAIGNAIAAGAQSGITVTYGDAGNKIDFSVADQWTGKDTDDLTEGTTNLYFTTERAQDAVGGSVGNGISYNDTSGAISVNLGVSGGLEFSTGAVVVDRDVTDTWYDAAGAASTVAGNLTTHISDTSTHGVTGDIVGTTDSQTLSNKTLGSGIVLSANVNAASTYTITNLATPSANTDAATKSYVDTSVSNLVDGAPGLLDTLNELAAAIGDDANFATTITTSIGTKVSKSGDTMTGALTLNADPSSSLHAATKSYVDNAVATKTAKYAVNNTLLQPTSNVVTWTVTHNLGSRDVTVQVYELSGYEQVEVDVARTNTTAVTLTWVATANVVADSYRAVVVG